MIGSIWALAINSDQPKTAKASRVRHGWLLPLWLLALWLAPALHAEVILEPQAFVASVFDTTPPPRFLWLSGQRKSIVTEILGHRYPALRLRYWFDGETSVWILEEIGKTEPITTGLAVSSEGLKQLRVLVYRESRGGEVRHSFFSDQFRGSELDDNMRLDQQIDGISGATLSVRALTNLGRMALYLHQQVIEDVAN
jgi:hypothetical protein